MNNNWQNGSGNRQGGYGRSNPAAGSRAERVEIKPEPLPEDYVTLAEDAIISVKEKGMILTTSKLRSLFSLFSDLFNDVTRSDQQRLSPDQVRALSGAKVRIYYEIGRDDKINNYINDRLARSSVGIFVQQSKLLEYLSDIGDSCEKLARFYHYMEALVAFHRFYFGEKRDNN